MKKMIYLFTKSVFVCVFILAFLFLTVAQTFSQGGAAINTTGASADPSAIIDASSNSQGLLIPRMTTAERNAISNPAEGLQIINTTTKCVEIYFSPMWQSMFCGCTPPSVPVAGTHSSSMTGIVWNWGAVSGATGYKYNTINDYSSSIDNGANTSYTQAGLSCGNTYTLYVWSYGACGNSSVATYTQATTACFVCGTSGVSFNYKGAAVNYGTVSGGYNSGQYCWLDRNLGATAVATASNHLLSYGDYFQWGRLDDGHQTSSSNTTPQQSANTTPGHSNFIIASINWYSGANPDALWQGVSGTNNPCPAGWRMPSETEVENERTTWSSYGGNNSTGALQSPLKLPAPGLRSYSAGAFYDVGSYGRYWTSTISGSSARDLFFTGSSVIFHSGDRADGMSVRCIKDY